MFFDYFMTIFLESAVWTWYLIYNIQLDILKFIKQAKAYLLENWMEESGSR